MAKARTKRKTVNARGRQFLEREGGLNNLLLFIQTSVNIYLLCAHALQRAHGGQNTATRELVLSFHLGCLGIKLRP